MENFKFQEYRDQLAKDLKGISDHEERKEALESEIGSWRYEKAKEMYVTAHPERVKYLRLEELKEENEMIDLFRDILKKEETRDKDRPFGERESYYTASSHCDYYEFRNLDWLPEKTRKKLFELSDRDTKWKEVLSEFQHYINMGYVTSAVKDEIDYEKNPEKWFHRPLSGLGSEHVKGLIESKGEPGVSEIIPEVEKAFELLEQASTRNDRGYFGGYKPKKRAEAIVVLKGIHSKLKKVNSGLLVGLEQLIAAVEKSVEEEKAELQK